MKGARGYLIVAVVVVLVVLGLNSAAKVDHGQRNVEIFTEMVYSKAAESFSPNAALPGGVTQQPLVAGVVLRGELPLRYAATPEEAQRAGRELENPFSMEDSAAVDRGRELYAVYCTTCHDPGGHGEGLVTQRGVPRPPSMHAARATQMKDGEMFHILTYGQGNMASYAAQLSSDERWKVILHVRSLQEQNK